jgi:membrane protein DedA with SNARE-associated domain
MFGGIFWLVALACAVWVIYDVVTSKKHMKKEMKLVWIICAVLFNVITAIVYYFVEKK